MTKKYVVRCDIEGVSGVVSYEQAEPGKSEFDFGKRMFMSDLLALINGLNDGGADEILIYDEHYFGRNIDLGDLPENVSVICGKPLYTKISAGGLDENCTGMILLGYHSKRGTDNALLNHTYEPDIKNIILNGVSVGEIGVEAAIAGDFDVPFVFITGDSEGVREARELVNNVEAVVVKESMTEFGALCYPTEKTYKCIYDTAKNIALKGTPDIIPYKVIGMAELRIEFFDTEFAQLYVKKFGEPIFKAKTVNECWIKYCTNKITINKMLAT